MNDIKPALSAEQWAAIPKVYFREPRARYPGGPIRDDSSYGMELHDSGAVSVWDDSWGLEIGASERHACAAICLYKQPFGFTQDDVDALEYKGVGYDEGHDDDKLASIATRIAALLPPR